MDVAQLDAFHLDAKVGGMVLEVHDEAGEFAFRNGTGFLVLYVGYTDGRSCLFLNDRVEFFVHNTG